MSKRMSRYPSDRKVYVGDLGNNARKNELEYIFSAYGTLRSVWVARNPPGFAFVEFEDARDAADAVRGLDGRTVCGRRARVELSTGKLSGRNERRGSSRSRGRPFHPDDKCYECGGRGHYARDCRRYGRSRRRSRSRSRSRSYSRDHRTRSRTGSRSNSRSRSKTPKSRSRTRDSNDDHDRRSRSRENNYRSSRENGHGAVNSNGGGAGGGTERDDRNYESGDEPRTSSAKHHHYRRNISRSRSPRHSPDSKSSRSHSNSRRHHSRSRSSHSRSHSRGQNGTD